MTQAPSTQEKLATVAASITGTLHDAAQDAKPVFERTVDRLSDSISDMAHQPGRGRRAKLLEQRHAIRHGRASNSLRTLQINIDCGRRRCAVATLVSWLIRSRPH
jgi:hypothetical protein